MLRGIAFKAVPARSPRPGPPAPSSFTFIKRERIRNIGAPCYGVLHSKRCLLEALVLVRRRLRRSDVKSRWSDVKRRRSDVKSSRSDVKRRRSDVKSRRSDAKSHSSKRDHFVKRTCPESSETGSVHFGIESGNILQPLIGKKNLLFYSARQK